MHENNFENQVHDKMQQLGFDPSDAVWTAVDKEINKDKKRRKPFLIFFLFSGLMLVGGGFYLTTIKKPVNIKATGQESTSKKEIENKQPVVSDESGKTQSETISGKTIDPTTVASSTWKQSTGSVIIRSEKKRTASYGSMDLKEGNNNIPEQNSVTVKNEKNNTDIITQAPVIDKSELHQGNAVDSSQVIKATIAVEKKNTPVDSVSGLKKTRNEKQKISLWKIAFTGGLGFSDINQSLFKQANSAGLYSFGPAVNTPSGALGSIPVSSDINTGFSFSAGLAVSRNLSKRISLSAGINYHYYSTHIRTGDAVDSSAIANGSIYSLQLQPYSVNGFYQNGSTHVYTNQYHFIELPVTIIFQLNKSKRLPVFWEAGLSLSYLVSTNALFFDPNGNLYYQNAQMFNKTQLSGVTAVMIGFPIHKNELQIGPQLQYGITSLLKSGTANSEHLIYGGLKLSYIFSMK
jgi:Outer membrane protein beta-barrel domain